MVLVACTRSEISLAIHKIGSGSIFLAEFVSVVFVVRGWDVGIIGDHSLIVIGLTCIRYLLFGGTLFDRFLILHEAL